MTRPTLTGATLKRPTLRDVANAAGVSKQAAGFALGRQADRLHPDTCARIRAEAQRLGYRPNLAARSLGVGRSGLITVHLPVLDNPFYATLAQALLDQAANSGHTLLLHAVRGGGAAPPSDWPVDGRIALDLNLPLGRNGPLVSAGLTPLAGDDTVRIDIAPALSAILTAVAACQPTRVVYLAALADHTSEDPRLAVYRRFCANHGWTNTCISADRQGRAEGCAAILAYVAAHGVPDALIVHNDLLAIGALRACRQLGLQPGRDLLVSGCDDIDEAADAEPPLTTIRFPFAACAAKLWSLLLSRIADPTQARRAELIAATAVFRTTLTEQPS